PYTHRHLARVALASEEVALRLGLGTKRARLVREAAILHDLGKIAIDEDILDKPAKLTPEEFDHVKQHSEFGERILAPVAEFQEMKQWIRHHHERPDGTGYPDQLRDSQIPIESKIIAVVDAYDAMTGGCEGRDKRSYRDPMTPDQAMQELERCSGTQFDKAVVKTFKRVIAGGTI
ncbi:MAG: HD domain-containing phosphohydrolase, partial [Fimbriimonadaceae bacterium]